MNTRWLRSAGIFVLLSFCTLAAAQQGSRAAAAIDADNDSLLQSRQRISQPTRTLGFTQLGSMTVRNGDQSTESVRDIAVRSFEAQETFARHMNRAELVSSAAIVGLPEVNDEVLVFDDSIVVRRSTTIIVIDPQRVAQESTLYADFLGDRAATQEVQASPEGQPAARKPKRMAIRQATQPAASATSVSSASVADLDAEERAGLDEFMRSGVARLHPKDPLRAAAAESEAAVLDAIVAGQGEFTVTDTLIIPTESGVDQGGVVAIPVVRDGVLDLRHPQPVKELSIKGIEATPPDPDPAQPLRLQAKPVPPKESPPRQPMQPKTEASGKAQITAEFLVGVTRAANFQWERTWSYTSGFFRLTLGSGYAIGYRVPVVAKATVEPTRGLIRDFEDKTVAIGVAAHASTANGNTAFFRNAGLPDSQVKNGKELLLEANVGFGYKFRAFWKTIASRPYTSIGVSYSQSFTPPDSSGLVNSASAAKEFGMTLDSKTTKASVNTTFVDGSATIRLDGEAWGSLGMDMKTLVDGKVQKTFDLKVQPMTPAGGYPFRITIPPKPLRQGTTTQVRTFGLRLTNPQYRARLRITPLVRFGFRVGYKRLSAHFSTAWIPLNSLQIDTGEFSMARHEGTRSSFTWNEGEKTFQQLEKPDPGPSFKN